MVSSTFTFQLTMPFDEARSKANTFKKNHHRNKNLLIILFRTQMFKKFGFNVESVT